ncbi:MAG: hypothetical protein R3C05_31535 [Pirellulaceae bacterium]
MAVTIDNLEASDKVPDLRKIIAVGHNAKRWFRLLARRAQRRRIRDFNESEKNSELFAIGEAIRKSLSLNGLQIARAVRSIQLGLATAPAADATCQPMAIRFVGRMLAYNR